MIGNTLQRGAESAELTPADLEPEPDPELTTEEVFEVLSNQRRRYALHYLLQEGSTDLGNLAEQVAAWECEKSLENVSSHERKRVYSALQQSHLPKMDAADVVKFDKREGVIEPTDATEELDIYLDVVRGNEITWSEYYVGLSGVALALVAAVWVQAYPFTLVPEVGWAAVLAVAFGVSSVAHLLHARRMKLGADDGPPGDV